MTADVSAPAAADVSTAAPTGLRRSPLAARAGDLAAASSGAVRLSELPFRNMVSLRVDPAGPAAAAVAEALHAPLPEALQASSYGERSVLWLGPDEFLVDGPDGDLPLYLSALTDVVGATAQSSAVDVSANRTTVSVTGPAAEALLAKGVTLDLHPAAFPAGRCAATTLARTAVILHRTAPDAFRLLVRCSFADYLADWLTDAALEFRTSAG